MKKTIIALFALAGVAMGSTVLTIDTQTHEFATDSWNLDGQPSSAGEATLTKTLSDGTEAKFHISNGRIWEKTVRTNTWVNSEAVDFMNTELNTSLTGANLTSIKTSASGFSGNRSTLTLNFENNAAFSSGSDMVFYLLVATSNDSNTASYEKFSVTGLNNATVYWANATVQGGFYDNSEKTMTSPTGEQLLVRVQGTLGDAQSVTFAADCNKNAWSMAAYNAASGTAAVPVVPEPTTATLSLLALAGLAARRRRK